MRADKKEDGGKQRESRDIWPVFLVREEFSSSVPFKVQRRNTKGNCRELLQRNVFYWAAERWFRSTKRRNHEQRSAMHNGIQGMRTEGVPFFRMSMQIRLFTDDDGEK